MKINLWWSRHAEEWRWSLCDEESIPLKQESGGQRDLRDAMSDIANTIEYITQKTTSD